MVANTNLRTAQMRHGTKDSRRDGERRHLDASERPKNLREMKNAEAEAERVLANLLIDFFWCVCLFFFLEGRTQETDE